MRSRIFFFRKHFQKFFSRVNYANSDNSLEKFHKIFISKYWRKTQVRSMSHFLFLNKGFSVVWTLEISLRVKEFLGSRTWAWKMQECGVPAEIDWVSAINVSLQVTRGHLVDFMNMFSRWWMSFWKHLESLSNLRGILVRSGNCR